jgi:pseudouridine synthase
LERALSKLGIASRTTARDWILSGRVSVNGVVQRDPLLAVNPEKTKIGVDQVETKAAESKYFLLHKPKGTVTTHSDEKGRPTVFDLLAVEKRHLIAAGRLDFATTGVLILTNHTQFAAWLTDPASAIVRTYIVTVRGRVSDETLEKLNQTVFDPKSGSEYHAEKVVLRKASGKESHLTVYLREGKNREVRNLFQTQGHEVTKLKRVAFGELELKDLPAGQYRELSPAELSLVFPAFFKPPRPSGTG